MAFILSYTFISDVLTLSLCKPTDFEISKRKCLHNITYWQVVLNIIADGFTILLPLPMVYKLRVRFAQKVLLVVLFLGGSM
jgi:hypothetical protein